MKKQIVTAGASTGNGPYSQGVIANGFAFVSGQGPLESGTGAIIGTTIEEQTKHTMDNVKAIVEAAGCTMQDVVQVTVYLANLGDFNAFNEVYQTYFSKPFPARSCVEAVLDGIMVEIDAIAAIPANLSE